MSDWKRIKAWTDRLARSEETRQTAASGAKPEESLAEEELLVSGEELRSLLGDGIPVQDACAMHWAEMGPGFDAVFVWFDVSARPDVKDLFRVHQSEGGGDCSVQWLFADDGEPEGHYYILAVEMSRPVHCTFHLPLQVEKWSQLLGRIAASKAMRLLPGPPVDWRQLSQWLSPEEMLSRYGTEGALHIRFDEQAIHSLLAHLMARQLRQIVADNNLASLLREGGGDRQGRR